MTAPAGGWTTGVVREIEHPNPMAVRLALQLPGPPQHLPGQHYVIKLTADDGYAASRSYSVASPPSAELVEFYVERFDDGEVSPYLADAVEVGDELELRGPIGGWFVWDGTEPAVGVAGGTGAVPLLAMLRHARTLGRPDLFGVAVAARTLAELPYASELVTAGAAIALSREAYDGRPPGHLTAADLSGVVAADATCYVCGSAGFAEAASELLMGLQVPPERIRVERFGPS